MKVAAFALAPKPDLIASLKEHGIVVMPSIGAAKHAVKVAAWGADAVMIQGGEGGGHTGPVPTTLLLPTVLDASTSRGRRRRLLRRPGPRGRTVVRRRRDRHGHPLPARPRPAVPDAVKQLYLDPGLTDTVVTAKVDGMPHRMLRTALVEELEETSAVKRMGPTLRRTLEFKRTSGMSGGARQGRPRDEEGRAGPWPRWRWPPTRR